MQHATSISAEEQDLRMAHAKVLRTQAGYTEQISTVYVMHVMLYFMFIVVAG